MAQNFRNSGCTKPNCDDKYYPVHRAKFLYVFCSLHCKDNMPIGQLYGTADVKNTNAKPY
jgi:hypothetical protein